jgi:hypothetical protein
MNDFETKPEKMEELDEEAHPFLMGKVSAVCNDEPTAKEIVDDMVNGAVARLSATAGQLVSSSRL